MRIVTNPGSNLFSAEVQRGAVFMTGQKIVVDDVQHETRSGMSLITVDHWVG